MPTVKVPLRSPINGEIFPPSPDGLAMIPDDVYTELLRRGFTPIEEPTLRQRKEKRNA